MSALALRTYEKDLRELVSEAITHTFSSMFGIALSVTAEDAWRYHEADERVLCEVACFDGDIHGAISAEFEKKTLARIAAQFFGADIADKPVILEGCAGEIINIVGTRVKNFLCDHGYQLHMNVPQLGQVQEFSSQELLHMTFYCLHGGVRIHLFLE